MASLRDFWRFLESRGPTGLRAAPSEWRDRCGPAFPCIEPMLRSSGRVARSWPGEHSDLPRRRVVTNGGAAVAVCDEGLSPRLEISLQDRVVHELPPAALRSAIAGALGLRTSTVPADRTPGVLRLGAWEPRPGLAFGVSLVAHGETKAVANLVRDAVLGEPQPTIVLTPTAELWTDDLSAWVERRRSILVPAEEAIHGGDDGLVATGAWPSFLEVFVIRAGVSLAAPTQNRRPRKKRAERLANIEKIESVLVVTARSRVALIRSSIDAGCGVPKIPHLTKAALAKEAGCKPHDVTRVFQDAAGGPVAGLYELVNDAEALWRTKGSRDGR